MKAIHNLIISGSPRLQVMTFEPKYSLTPLVFGTLKAAFYAMMYSLFHWLLWARFIPLILWRQPLRRVVKPSIEIMEALPTVILGFPGGALAGSFYRRAFNGGV